MNSKILFLGSIMLVLIVSDSMAKKGRKGRFGKFGRGGPEYQFKRICKYFEDESSVFDACEDIKENVETFMNEKKEDTKTFMEEQKGNLEDVVRTVCENMNDDNSTTTCDGRMKANICRKLTNH